MRKNKREYQEMEPPLWKLGVGSWYFTHCAETINEEVWTVVWNYLRCDVKAGVRRWQTNPILNEATNGLVR